MAVTVRIRHQDSWHADAWATKNCPSYLHNIAIIKDDEHFEPEIVIDFIFNEPGDAVLFKLMWAE